MLEELQSLSEAKKKRVLIIATIIIMIIIVGIWVSYLNSIVAGPAEQQAAATPALVVASAPAPAAASGPSVWQNIEHWFGSAATSIENIFRNPSQYNIQPQNN